MQCLAWSIRGLLPSIDAASDRQSLSSSVQNGILHLILRRLLFIPLFAGSSLQNWGLKY
jgi:hypothetical protein